MFAAFADPRFVGLLAQEPPPGFRNAIVWVVGVGIVIAFVIFVAIVGRYLGLYVQCVTTGARIGLLDLVVMSLRKINPTVIVRAMIMAVQAGLLREYPIHRRQLQAHYLAGGNVMNVVRALIAAQKAKIDLNWDTAAAIDLAGRDVLDAVKTSVYPKVIDCPDPKKKAGTLDAVAGDGIQLRARARVTVRTNLKQLIGGATEETIIARVGQGIVEAIGSTDTYAEVLENPDRISRVVLGQGLEAHTAYEIVSIDIADIDVGENIKARLDADQAEADMRVAQAKAEEKRAMAMAREQEMVAHTQENRAQVVLSEAEVPEAVANAFRSGKLGLVDYYELQNVKADTRMRASIAGDAVGSDDRK